MRIIKLNSIRVKMGIFSTLILGGILVLYSFYLYFELKDALYANFDDELRVKAYELGRTVKAFQKTKSPAGDIHYAAIKVLKFDVDIDQDSSVTLADRQWFRLIDRYELDKDYVSILSLEGDVLATSGNMSSELRDKLISFFDGHRQVRSTWERISYEGEEMRVLQRMMFARDEPHYLIQIASPMTAVYELLQDRLQGIAISIPFVLVFFSLAGFILSNQILRPVRKIAETAERLTYDDLSRRVKLERVDAEMLFLVNAFNKMIERLEASFRQIANIASHIAHELKTPLAVIRGEAQMALRKKEQKPKIYREVIESSFIETERMLKVINDLLLITNVSYNKDIFNMEPLKLGEFLGDIYQKSQILAEPKKISVDYRPPDKEIVIKADPTHLRRLFFNIIDNAIKYNFSGGRVKIFTKLKERGVVIFIEDNGKGIAPADLAYIREYVLQEKLQKKSKEKKSTGTGFGLYLCRAIAQAHKGDIKIESKLGQGSLFSLYLPFDR